MVLGGAHDHAFYANLLIGDKTPHERIVAHNWRMATERGEVFLDQVGKYIEHFRFPLLPAVEELRVDNEKLVVDMKKSIKDPKAGGKDNVPDIFRQEEDATPAPPARSSAPSRGVQGGAPWAAVVPDNNGQLFTDLAAVADELAQVNRRIDGLQAQRGGGRRPANYNQRGYRGRGRGGPRQWAPNGGETDTGAPAPVTADF
jgi:hypothetical protein